MRVALVLATVAAAAAGCGGSDGTSTPTPAPSGGEAATYAAAERALKREDFDGAISRLRSLGTYRDARERLLEVRKVAGDKTFASARQKLRMGHTRAAVSQATTAIETYGNDTPATRALLRRAQAAQDFFHACQERRGVDGEQSRPCERAAARKFAPRR